MVTDTPKTRTKAEIDDLIRQWHFDPSWDLEDTEGFEAHHDELLAVRMKHEDKVEKKLAINARLAAPFVRSDLGDDRAIALSAISHIRMDPNGDLSLETQGDDGFMVTVTGDFARRLFFKLTGTYPKGE